MTEIPSFRAVQTSGGPAFDDPSEEVLLLLMEQVEAGDSEFLTVERPSDPTGSTWIQAAPDGDGSYTVQFREGPGSRPYSTNVPNMRAAHGLVTGWVYRTPGWGNDAQWTEVDI